ncbi:MAG TPA: hypothetical protein PK052_01100 [Anaerohalosphaeraceae bacterium]|nr:hypothetical protein [Phycisphaerae bacterium]HOL30553.1 hypothetical protein [Anaerohalosphaeraceae bacterium]HOM75195.1 hypothetical protein [Anaerohalosphaeraceae bacterium]HPC64011.1 hypothetical protein [Anaerohalosphaeraceae bacterium]HRS71710.1 hypothetical protein [Anaerohalosphaeraceae bacterium]
MKSKDILRILENQIDKIVLGVIALISLFLLWVYVIGSPYSVEIDRRRLGPGDIDRYIKQKVEQALPAMEQPAVPVVYDKTYLADFDQYVRCAVPQLSTLSVPYPGAGDIVIEEERMYALPQIPPLTDVAVAALRGAAQLPTEEIGPDRPYKQVVCELGDIDLITVSAKLNVQNLYNNFMQSFKGPRLKSSWQDPVLAKPVFAKLELQRRVKQGDGTWGDWETVPRAKIDAYKKLLEELPMTLEQAQLGVGIWRSQFENTNVQFDILQPEAYTFTISRTEWMPPKFLLEAFDILKKEEQAQERKRREEQSRQRTTPNVTDPTRPTPQRRQPVQPQRPQQQQTRPGTARRGGQDELLMGPGFENPALLRPEVRKERTITDVKNDMQKEILKEKDNIEIRKDPLLVWAHDDTAVPGKTYQYRIRLGVFNPIAGKDWFQSDQVAFKNQTVLWSSYTDPTPEVYVPKRVYVFPMEVILKADASKAVEGVKVEVDKYYLGQWRDFDFDVYPGQIIGYEVEDVDKKTDPKTAPAVMGEFMPMMAGELGQPQKVDFTTDLMLVDIIQKALWNKRPVYQMLYYDKEQRMQQIAVGRTNWSVDIRRDYEEIQNAKQQALQQLSPGFMQPAMPEMMPIDPLLMMGPGA